jgi:hypothetical protein
MRGDVGVETGADPAVFEPNTSDGDDFRDAGSTHIEEAAK